MNRTLTQHGFVTNEPLSELTCSGGAAIPFESMADQYPRSASVLEGWDVTQEYPCTYLSVEGILTWLLLSQKKRVSCY